MTTLENIKNKIKTFFNEKTVIHISVEMSRPRVHVESAKAMVVGVYPNIFQIEVDSKRYTLQYTDCFTDKVKITELNEEK